MREQTNGTIVEREPDLKAEPLRQLAETRDRLNVLRKAADALEYLSETAEQALGDRASGLAVQGMKAVLAGAVEGLYDVMERLEREEEGLEDRLAYLDRVKKAVNDFFLHRKPRDVYDSVPKNHLETHSTHEIPPWLPRFFETAEGGLYREREVDGHTILEKATPSGWQKVCWAVHDISPLNAKDWMIRHLGVEPDEVPDPWDGIDRPEPEPEPFAVSPESCPEAPSHSLEAVGGAT